jgi:hypothetical protein
LMSRYDYHCMFIPTSLLSGSQIFSIVESLSVSSPGWANDGM